MTNLTPQQLKSFFGAKASPAWIDAFADLSVELCGHYQMTPLRLAHLFAQIGHETSGLALDPCRENMRYKSAARIKQVFSKRLTMALKSERYARYGTVDALARTLINNPTELANVVYGGREGSPPWDGRYIGRGPLQCTHLDNYRAAALEIAGQPGGLKLDLITSPSLLEEPRFGVRAAFAEWHLLGLSEWADRDDVAAVSAKLNVGDARRVASVIGLPERRAWLKKAKAVWPETTSRGSESGYTSARGADMPKAKKSTPNLVVMSTDTVSEDTPPWLADALSRLGQKEIAGKKNNPAIMACFVDCGHDIDSEGLADETAWCAAGAGSCLKRAGYPIPPPNVNLMARSYRTYGVPCAAKRGAIGVWPRWKYPQGHVGFITKVNANGTVDLAAGNQGNAWSIVKGKYRIDEALALRWPVAATKADLKAAGSTEIKLADSIKNAATATPIIGGGATAVKEALSDPTPVTTAPATAIDQLRTASEGFSLVQAITEGAVAFGHMVMENLWIVGVLALSGGAWWAANRWQQGRVARAAAGLPLSQETSP